MIKVKRVRKKKREREEGGGGVLSRESERINCTHHCSASKKRKVSR